MRSLIEIKMFTCGEGIVMHTLLQKVGNKVIHKQEPWKRQILIDPQEICQVLEDAKGTRLVSGISFDIFNINEVCISERAFKRMSNLRFLRVYKSRDDGNYIMHIPEEMEFPRSLRLLHWEAYPCKSLRHIINPKYLVELEMRGSQLEKLWEGIQPLKYLKKMDLSHSKNLEELPDLSMATNLEELHLRDCESLVEIPSSFRNLHKLEDLLLSGCINLQVVPADMNLPSLEVVDMHGCSRLRNTPLFSTKIYELSLSLAAVEDLPATISLCSRLFRLNVSAIQSKELKGLTHIPKSVNNLDLRESAIENIPDSIKDLHDLSDLNLNGCRRLASLPKLPRLIFLHASDCESLETVFCPLSAPYGHFNFSNCFKLNQQTRREMIEDSSEFHSVLLPGGIMPTEFDQRAKGNTLTVVIDRNRSYSGLVFCLVLFPHENFPRYGFPTVLCRPIGQNHLHARIFHLAHRWDPSSRISTEHLFIFRYSFKELYRSEVNTEMMFEFSINARFNIIECGGRNWIRPDRIEGSSESRSDQRTN